MYVAYSGVPDSPIICLHAFLEEFAQCVIKHSLWHLINKRHSTKKRRESSLNVPAVLLLILYALKNTGTMSFNVTTF